MAHNTTVAIAADGVLWPARRAWPAAIDHLGTRMGRIRPLPDSLATIDHDCDPASIAADVAAIVEWASDDIPWQRTLERWFDEHMAIYARGDRDAARALNQFEGDVFAWSALPEPVAEAALRHTGTQRHIDRLLPDVLSDADLATLVPDHTEISTSLKTPAAPAR